MDAPITLITGTRKGIGRYLAEHYLASNHIVIGCSRGDSELSHANYHHFQADVSEEKDVKRVFIAVRKKFGHIDNLLNNAGVASMNHSLLTPATTLKKILDTNVVGSFLFCREAAKIMKASGYGRIVNFSTVAVPLKLEGEAAYVASKSAVEAITHVLSREFAEFGITVNTIGPVPIETDLISKVPKNKIESLVARQSIARFGKMSDVSNVVDFYLRKESDFVTGQCIYLGGI